MGAAGVAAGDFHGNGKVDLLYTVSGNNSVLLMQGNGDGTFQGLPYVVSTIYPERAAADLNGDGNTDLFLAGSQTHPALTLLGDGKGAFPGPNPTSSTPQHLFMTLGDFNGDGKLDLVTANTDVNSFHGQIRVQEGNGDGTFVPL